MKKLSQERINMLELWMNNTSEEWQMLVNCETLNGGRWVDLSESSVPELILTGYALRIKPKTTVYFCVYHATSCSVSTSNLYHSIDKLKATIDPDRIIGEIYTAEIPL